MLRTTGAYDFIGWWDFPAERAADIAAREAAFFRPRKAEFEWKVFSHDRPAGLERALAAAGYEAQATETLVALDLEEVALGDAPPPGVEIRRVRDAAGVADYVAANAQAFGRDETESAESWLSSLGDPELGLYVAYEAGEPIAAGRLELNAGTAVRGPLGRRNGAGTPRPRRLSRAGGGARERGAATRRSLR